MPTQRSARPAGQSHLAHYAQCFSAVEINSSFYRPHRATTYARWREETPAGFRFSVKMPRSITHESHLKRCSREVGRFYDEIVALQPKLGAVLVQLPASLDFDRRSVRTFFGSLPQLRGTRVVCEPRHPSWFTRAADAVLREASVGRVAADPARCAGADIPGGARRIAYFRWHGSPRMYYSKYTVEQLGAFAALAARSRAPETWCIFDNTARYAAWDDALQLMARLRSTRHGGAQTT